MSRFENLEFDRQPEGHARAQDTLKDGAAIWADAMRAFEQGQFETALRLFARVLQFDPQNAGAWTGQVRMLIELGDFEEARRWADTALERFPREAELLAAKAVALGRLGDAQAALAFSDASIEEHGDTPYVWMARGDVLMARKESRADYCFEKAHLMAPQNWFVHWLASRVQFYHRKFARALKLAQQALALDSAQAVVWLQLGKCQEALGMVALAQTSYEQALQLHPESIEARKAIAGLQPAGWLASIRAQLNGLFSR